MSGNLAASGCELVGIVMVVQGVVISQAGTPPCDPICLPYEVITPDITGNGGVIDGAVDAFDFGQFGLVYDNPPAYDRCFDYTCNGVIDIFDFGRFGEHWEHTCQGI
jgi:hypothetical protein